MKTELTNMPPRYTRETLERKAEELLSRVDPSVVRFAQKTPLDKLIQYLSPMCPVIHDQLLGSIGTKRILGKFEFNPPRIFIDAGLIRNSPRYLFTLAHEIGHYVLHGNNRFDLRCLDQPAPQTIFDSRQHIRVREFQRVTNRDWMEWHANTFAATLLMPSGVTIAAVTRFQRESLGLSNRVGTVFLDEQNCNRLMYRQTIDHLKNTFGTSAQMIHIRLEKLGILRDVRRFHRGVASLLRTSEQASIIRPSFVSVNESVTY